MSAVVWAYLRVEAQGCVMGINIVKMVGQLFSCAVYKYNSYWFIPGYDNIVNKSDTNLFKS